MARIMKESGIKWLGKIPNDWEVRKVKNYYSIQTGFTPDTKKEEYYDDINGEDWVNISDIQDGYIITDTKHKISKLYVEQFRPTLIPKGSLMYSFKLSVGQVAFAGKDIYSNEAIASFLPNEKVNLSFLRYSSCLIIENAETNIYNAKILNQDRIKNAHIIFPPLKEQERIANFLDEKCDLINSVIEKTKTSIEEYKILKQAIITQAVTKGIRGERPMKDSGIEWIGQIPKEWKVSRVGLHYNVILGKMLCTTQIDESYSLEKYYCAANVHFDGISDGELKEMWFSPDEIRQYRVREGDLLVVEGGAGAGGCAVANACDEPVYIQNSIMIVRPKKDANAKYLKYLIEFLVKNSYIDVVCNKATIPHFTKDKLSCVPLPISSEQKEISEYLDRKCDELDVLINKKYSFVQKMLDYKKSLIYEYVTGKRQVNA